MNKTQKWFSAIAAAAILAAVSAMIVRHSSTTTPHSRTQADVIGAQPQLTDEAIGLALQQANVDTRAVTVRNVGGIVILKGTADAAAATRAVATVRALGYTRVANLLQPPAAIDDEGIRREAERQLANARQLDGCVLRVSCNQGVLRVSGTVQSELQQDAARSVLRTVRGAREVKVELSKL